MAVSDISMDLPPAVAPPARAYLVHRHALAVRVTHWINALAIVMLIGTGFNIFNAHPRLYWGQYGSDRNDANRWLEIGATQSGAGPRGYFRIGSLTVDTTGVLGASKGANGTIQPIGYPGWATIPSARDLATARNFHFFFAWVLILNGLVYLGTSLATGHIRRNILPTRAELRPANILHDIAAHARLQFPKGEDARRYHILQKLAYGGIILVLVPLVIFTGLAMSPGTNAAWPWLTPLFGGRQSARSLHWIATNLILVFTIVHLAMVILAGPYNEIRSMVTGKFRVDPKVKP